MPNTTVSAGCDLTTIKISEIKAITKRLEHDI